MGWLLRLFRKSRTESELDQELRFHLERQIFDNLSAGMSPEEARRDALIKLGGLEQTKESDCDTRGSLTINSVLRDLHFGFRLLRKNPAFTLIVVGLLAFGIGVNTAFFSVLDATLLRPLPVRDPESLVRIVQKFPKVGSMNSLPRAYYDTLHEHSTMLPAVFGEAIVDTTLSGMGPAESVRVYLPTPEYFEGLGTHALHGRTLTTSDAANQAGPIPAVLSYRFWKQRFDGNVNAIGRTLVLHQNVFVIVGVLPREFNGLSADTAPDVRVPLRALPLLWDPSSSRPMAYVEFELAGRLKPGVTRQQAQAECLALWLANVTDYYPHYPEQARFTSRIGVALDPLKHGVSRVGERYGDTMKLLMVCGGLLLLTVCATLGGLLFARSAVRRYEIGVRLAIGATPGQIMRQMITESLLLTIAGGIGGLVIAYLLPSVLASYIPPVRDVTGTRMALSIDLGLNYRVLAFSFILSAATALLFALAPAIITSRVPIDSVLRDTRASARVLGRQVVVIFQIALCTVALVLAGLLIRTIERLSRVDTGFDQDHVVTLSVDPSLSGYTTTQEVVLIRELMERIRALPAVQSVGLSAFGVMRGRGIVMTVAPAGAPAALGDNLNTSVNYVSPEYFSAMGMQLLAGEDPRIVDLTNKPRKIVVNQAFSNHFFPHTNALGAQVGTSEQGRVAGPDYVIAGVVSNAKYRSLREPIIPIMYILTNEFSSVVLSVRAHGQPAATIGPIRGIFSAIDSSLPLLEISTLEEDIEASTAGERITMVLASTFGGLEMLMTALGIYGLMAYVVTETKWELGLRMALGAPPRVIAMLLGRQAFPMVLSGVVLGVIAGLMCTPLMRSVLYGVSPSDWRSFISAVLFVLMVVTAGLAVPLARAVTIRPAEALRTRQ